MIINYREYFAIGFILSSMLTACTTSVVMTTEPIATSVASVSMPNPASAFCTENGNQLVIQTTADGSQTGICIFPDGTTCEEWAYFRGECGPTVKAIPTLQEPVEPVQIATEVQASGGYMAPGTAEEFSDWWGVIKSTESGAQFDDYFERQDMGQVIYFGIDSNDPEVKSQIETLRDSGKIVHLYGTLLSNVPDYNGSQVLVDRIVVE